jgi:hypothetical protein
MVKRGRKSEWIHNPEASRFTCPKGYILGSPSGIYYGFVNWSSGIWQVPSSHTLKAVKRAVIEKWKELEAVRA